MHSAFETKQGRKGWSRSCWLAPPIWAGLKPRPFLAARSCPAFGESAWPLRAAFVVAPAACSSSLQKKMLLLPLCRKFGYESECVALSFEGIVSFQRHFWNEYYFFTKFENYIRDATQKLNMNRSHHDFKNLTTDWKAANLKFRQLLLKGLA